MPGRRPSARRKAPGALLALLGLLLAAPATGQPVKCKDDRGRLTYSDKACDKLGLKDAGPVADRTTVIPSPPLPRPAAKKDASKKDAAKKGDEDRPGTGIKPANPLIDKMLQVK